LPVGRIPSNRPYCPGELLMRTALIGPDLSLTGVSAARPIGPSSAVGSQSAKPSQQEPPSQCSTVDTVGSDSRWASDFDLGPLLDDSEVGSVEVPTLGSKSHYLNQCKPCAFLYKEEGCRSGIGCTFCHLCEPGEKKRRKKEKQTVVRSMRQLRHSVAASWNAWTTPTF